MPDFGPAFRKWFGDSKVVDADGNPLVVYHGTRASFSVFDADIGPDRGGLLAFFSESPKFGAMYSKQGSEEYVEGSNVMPVYLAIQRPFDYRVHWKAAGDYYEFAGGPQDSWELDRLAADHYRVLEEELTDRQRERYGAAQFVKQVKSGSWLPLEIPSFVMYLREQGFDGLRMREMRSVNWGVFEPTQVKSATGNDGTWDADDPDIRSNPSGVPERLKDIVHAVGDTLAEEQSDDYESLNFCEPIFDRAVELFEEHGIPSWDIRTSPGHVFNGIEFEGKQYAVDYWERVYDEEGGPVADEELGLLCTINPRPEIRLIG